VVFETDQFGNLTYVTGNWLKSFHYSSEDVESGLNISNVLKAERGPIVLGNESSKSLEYTMVRKDGTTSPSIVYTNSIHRENKVMGFRRTIIDVSKRKKAHKV